MLENPNELIKGLKIALKILNLNKGYFGIEENKADAINILTEMLIDDSELSVISLKTKYPQGSEKQIIKAITGRNVPTGKLPADVGVVVLNVDTVYALYKAFYEGLPPVRRIVTVSGECIKNPGNFDVPLGVKFSYMFDAAGGFITEPHKILMGGPMMGVAQYSTDAPIIKTTSALLALPEAAVLYDPASVCIRCGKCVDYCSMHLMPLNLAKFSEMDNLDMLEKYHVTDCMECGLCSYVCPARRNPSQLIKNGKQAVIERIKSKAAK